MARAVHRLPGRLRRPAPERRQHGQSHLLPGCPRRAGRLGCSQARCRRWAVGCVSTPPRKLTHGSRKPLIWLASARKRFIGSTVSKTMDLHELDARYRRDMDEGYQPFLVVGSAGTVSTGAVDPLPDLAAFCRSANSGSTSTAPMGHSHLPSQERLRNSRGCSRPIPWPWILTNGCTLRSRLDVRSSATLRL